MRRVLALSKILIFSFLTSAGVLWSHSVAAQFTYLKAGVGYSVLPFRIAESLNSTSLHQVSLNLSGMYRPIEPIGFGINVKFPVVQFNSFTFSEKDQYFGDGAFFDWKQPTMSSVRDRYIPDTYDYTFRQSVAIEVFGRLFVGGTSAFFIDWKFSHSVLEERFTLQRAFRPAYSTGYSNNYPAIESVNIRDNNRRVMNMPGITFGHFQHISDYFFYDFGFSVDVVIFNQSGFSYTIEHDLNFSSGTPRTIRMTSQAAGMRPLFSLNCSVGLFF